MKIVVAAGSPLAEKPTGEMIIIDNPAFVMMCFNTAIMKQTTGFYEEARMMLKFGIYNYRTLLTRQEQTFIEPRRQEAIEVVQVFEEETG